MALRTRGSKMRTEPMFTDEEQDLLKQIARGMIPPAPTVGLPGTNDERIFECNLIKVAERGDRLRRELLVLINRSIGIWT